MGEVIDVVARLKAREYARLWKDALTDKPGSMDKVRTLVVSSPEFRLFCEMMYREHMARRAEAIAFDDGA